MNILRLILKKKEDFPKGMIYIVEDSKEIIEENEELGNKYGRDQGKSCQII